MHMRGVPRNTELIPFLSAWREVKEKWLFELLEGVLALFSLQDVDRVFQGSELLRLIW